MPVYGLTRSIEPVSPGVDLKKPHQSTDEHIEEQIANNFTIERQIPKRFGRHPRIVRYLGLHGNLQAYLGEHHASTPLDQHLLWCRQLAKALDYIYSHGVLHLDLRLGHDLLLADSGGSIYKELGLDGLSLPDGPFSSPIFNWRSSVSLDLFGISSTFYMIYTGRWLYKVTPGRFESFDERIAWEKNVVYANFKQTNISSLRDTRTDMVRSIWPRDEETA
ncbi:hypothetical protein L209DRAFT_773123 [Thermothelomyces heterothallicus CBS 203.75]